MRPGGSCGCSSARRAASAGSLSRTTSSEDRRASVIVVRRGRVLVKSDDRPDVLPPGEAPEDLLDFLSRHRQRRQARTRRNLPVAAPGRRALVVLAGIAAALVLAGVGVAVWETFGQAKAPNGAGDAGTSTAAAASTSTHRRSHGLRSSARSRARTQHPIVPAPARPVTVRLTAARGDCWVQLRTGGPQGRVLYEGTIQQGQSARFTGRRLWARFGSFANLDLSVNGHAIHSGLTGTLDAFLSPGGIRVAPTAPQGG